MPASVHATATFTYYKIIIAAQLQGKAALPYELGLSTEKYQTLLSALADDELSFLDQQWRTSSASQAPQKRSALLSDLLAMRLSEQEALITLLMKDKSSHVPFVEAAAVIVATACLNPSHLWKSLGFNARSELSEWLNLNFPVLSATNIKTMRWKRFFYLKLCEQGGDYVCRAPSCEQCTSFDECFGPE